MQFSFILATKLGYESWSASTLELPKRKNLSFVLVLKSVFHCGNQCLHSEFVVYAVARQ